MIVIQGAGIAGLTLAGLLEQCGMDYLVVEQSPQLQPIGAGIVLQRNALEVLAKFPAGDFEADSIPLHRMTIGSEKQPVLQAIELDHATRARGVHRGKLQSFLLQQVDLARLKLATSIDSWSHNGAQLEVKLNSGECVDAHALVGADGLSSGIRASLTGQPHVRNSGQWCARTVVSGQPAGGDAVEIHAGRHRLGAIPLADNKTYVFWVCSRHSGEVMSRDEIEATIGTMGAIGASIAALFSADQPWLQHPLVDIPVYWGKGRVVLIGDAAHALTPNLGQGAALGIEDAYVLAGYLANGGPSMPHLAQQLRQQRHARVRNIRTMSYLMGKVAHVEQPMLRRVHNRLLKMASPSRSRSQLRRWLDQFSVDSLGVVRS